MNENENERNINEGTLTSWKCFHCNCHDKASSLTLGYYMIDIFLYYGMAERYDFIFVYRRSPFVAHSLYFVYDRQYEKSPLTKHEASVLLWRAPSSLRRTTRRVQSLCFLIVAPPGESP